MRNGRGAALSIVIAMYNAADSIGRCLRSVFAQVNGYEIEVIVVDDGSSDGCAHIVQSAADAGHIVRLIKQGNAGPYAARRRGIREATGDFIICVDSDDCLLPGAVEQVQMVLEEFPEVDFIWYQHCRSTKGGVACDKGIMSLGRGGLFEGSEMNRVRSTILRGTSNELWSKAIRSSLLKKESEAGNRPKKLGEDFSQLLDVLVASRSCYVINQVLYSYTDSGEGLSENYDDQTVSDILVLSGQLKATGALLGGSCFDASIEGVLAQFYNLAKICNNVGIKRLGWLGEANKILAQAQKMDGLVIQSNKLRMFWRILRLGQTWPTVTYVKAVELLKRTIRR